MNELTILLSLKDRSEETKKWYVNNYHKDFNYIIADGSIGDENQKIFSQISHENLIYLRINKDVAYNDYYKKVYDASLMVKTPFVMQVDNDDVINFLGIKECLQKINQDNSISLISGHIAGFNFINGKYYLSDFKENKCDHISNNDNFNQIESYLKNYRIIWYSIYRTKIFQKAWEDCVLFSCKYNVNNEFIHGLSALVNGKFYFYDNTTYLRNTNQPNSIYKKTSSEELEKSKSELVKIISYIAEKYKLDKNKVFEFHNKRRNTYKRRNILSRIILTLIRKRPQSISQIINKLNKLNFIS